MRIERFAAWRGPRGAAVLLALLFAPAVTAQLPALRDIAELAGGEFHTCALTVAGAVKCWGSNRQGQLGAADISTAQRETPVDVVGLGGGVVAIAAGRAHTCALRSGGNVVCWGQNGSGQLGDGSLTPRPTPVAVAGLGESAVAISTGEEHTCAVILSGALRCWGSNASGQLGTGTNLGSPTPVTAEAMTSGVTAVAAGAFHTCAVRGAGALCWGRNDGGQLGDGSIASRSTPGPVTGQTSNVRALSAGRLHTCALSPSGGVSCWGNNLDGQIGDGTLTNRRVAVALPGLGSAVQSISVSLQHSCAIVAGGTVKCWGDNFFGQIGDGSATRRPAPTDVGGIGTGALRVASGYRHACAIVGSTREVRCWGNNFDGQIGDGSFSNRLAPREVAGLTSDAVLIGTGFQHSCAFLASGEGRCWGDNASGQLGNGSLTASALPVPMPSAPGSLRAMEGGTFHSCLLTQGGAVRCWGSNSSGQIGDGTATSRSTPVDVAGLSGGVSAIATGGFHSCAVVGGAARCWGANSSGQLGTGNTVVARTPAPVSGLDSGVVSIAAGLSHSCALTASGTVRCWGANAAGQLGTGSDISSLVPVEVDSLAGIVAIAAGGDFTCALSGAGVVRCWGDNDYGQIGDTSLVDRRRPTQVNGLTRDVRAIDTSSFHACAITAARGLVCWGRNLEGQLGNNGTESRSRPVDVAGLSRGVAQVSAGGGQTCARLEGGAVRCWGANNFGQVGDGSTWAQRSAVTTVVDEVTRQVAGLTPAANAESRAPVSDASGRYVVFQSRASNLVPGDSNASSDIFRIDTQTGSTIRVSVDNTGQQIGAASIEPTLSGDGTLVAFVAPDAAVGSLLGESATDAKARRKNSGFSVLLRNLVTNTTQTVGPARSGGTGTAPTIAAGGGAIAWVQPNAGIGVAGQHNIYLVRLTRQGSSVTIGPASCATCSFPGGGTANGESRSPAISADGRWLTWETTATNVPLGGGGKSVTCPAASSHVLLLDLIGQQAAQLNRPAPGAGCGSDAGATQPVIDDAGKFVAFSSTQPLLPQDGNSASDVYVYDRDAATLRLASAGQRGEPASGDSSAPAISGDGSTVAFVSAAPDLDLSFADNNERADVHVVGTAPGSNPLRLSRSPSGGEAAAASDAPALNASGTLLVFDTQAANLAGGAAAGLSQVAQRAVPAGAAQKSATWWNPAEGGWGAFTIDQGNVLALGWFTYDDDGEPTWFLVPGATVAADGRHSGSVVRVAGVRFDQISGTASRSVTTIGSAALRFSGNTLEFDYTVNGTRQVRRLERFVFGTRTLVCRAAGTASRAGAINYSDLWWSGPASAGWGVHMSHVGDDLFVTWYTYDPDGEATFLVGATRRQTDGSFSGPLFRQRNGTPFLQIDGRPPSPGSDTVGSATLRFSDGERATFSYTLGTVTQSKPLSRYVFGAAPGSCSVAALP